jgi:hypothetical protein
LLAQSRWFSPGTPASSTTKTGCHDIAESAVKTSKIKSNHQISSKAQTHKGIYSPVELRVIYIMLNVEDDHVCVQTSCRLVSLFVSVRLHTGTAQENEKKLNRPLNFTYRYIYDALSINNSQFGDFVDHI